MPRKPKTPPAEEKVRLTPVEAILLEEANREVTIRGAAGSEQITMRDAIVRKLIQVAVGGSPHALNQVMRYITQAERKREIEIEEDVATGREFVKNQTILLNEALRKGNNPDTVLPHPDDIVVKSYGGWKIIGPTNEEELADVYLLCRLRDTLILQDALEDRLDWPEQAEPWSATSNVGDRGSALLFACLLNDLVPKRFQLTGDDMLALQRGHARNTKRELLKQTYKAWAAIKMNKPRGWRTPTFRQAIARFESASAALADIVPRIASGELKDPKAIEQALQPYL